MKTSTVTATEANRSFSKLLRAVARGERIDILSHGRKVAVLQPAADDEAQRSRQLAGLARLREQWSRREFAAVGPWTREELYERD